MTIDPLLARLVPRLRAAVGVAGAVQADDAAKATGAFLAPLDQWTNRTVLDFIDHLRQLADDEYMGLGAGPCAPGASNFLIELGTRCATLREAITMGLRFMRMATRAIAFDLAEEGERAVITFREAASPRDPGLILSDWTMISWHKLMQWLIGSEIWLERTEFAHPLEADYTDYAAMFGSNCIFQSDAGRLVFARALLDRRIIRLPGEGDRLKPSTPGYFGKPGLVSRTWQQLVRNLLHVEMAKGNPPLTIEELATEFGVSSQTVRRRLREEGIGFRALKAEVRMEIARHMLVDRQVTQSEASIAAGFAEPNALSRALRLSQGISPRELRSQVLGETKGKGEARDDAE
ncbi:AraC family transcriptional regulator ligand-binding domain-containing protein [Novosphingobium bradum]|uniref:AraC family transcriptional regulator ligand-binding domain-containing protein n=1 Tax=Novosphingobium bradum TaxID=1737444 RepID=A0ABV7INH3_9SPHN